MVLTFSGDVPFSDVREADRRIWEHSHPFTLKRVLIDLRQVTNMAINLSYAVATAQMDIVAYRDIVSLRMAIIATRDDTKAFCSTYRDNMGLAHVDVQLFETHEDAEKWLFEVQ